jgi:hypothetical protein
MSEANENNFSELKRLLKLKQHEVPPPGYFNHFSGDVIARIRADREAGVQSALERSENSWLTNLLHIFQARPGMIGGLATSCLLLLIGVVVLADRTDGVATGGTDMASAPSLQNDATALASAAPLAPADSNSGIALSTNRVSLQPVASLFGSQQNPLFQSAAFMPAGQ